MNLGTSSDILWPYGTEGYAMRSRTGSLLGAVLVSVGILAAQDAAPPIQYVVVIFQENVSFDHYFGTYPVALNPVGEPRFALRTDMPTPGVNGLSGALMKGNPN